MREEDSSHQTLTHPLTHFLIIFRRDCSCVSPSCVASNVERGSDDSCNRFLVTVFVCVMRGWLVGCFGSQLFNVLSLFNNILCISSFYISSRHHRICALLADLKGQRRATFSRSSIRVVLFIVHILDNLQVFLEVGVFEVFVLLLVLGRLTQVSLANVVHDLDTLLQRRDRILVVLREAQILLVHLDLVEALHLELCALQLEPQIADLFLQLLDFEVDSRGLAEDEGPLEERTSEGEVV